MRLSAPTLARFAWIVTGYTVVVILFGAYVRATSSGAGCGSHWPLCNGTVVPRIESTKMLVEFTHRTTSGLAWMLALLLGVLARFVFPKGHLARKYALGTFVFMTSEALIGAGLVLFKMVAENDSLARAVWMACHLVNTFILLFCCTATAWFSSGGERFRYSGRGARGALLGLSMLGVLVLATTGSVAALGDTLFPASSLLHGLEQDMSPTAHLLVRLRVLHPVMGLAVAACVLGTLSWLWISAQRGRRLIAFVGAVFVVQVVVGFLNLGLLAPVALQLGHLFLADCLWIGLALVSATTLSASPLADSATQGSAQSIAQARDPAATVPSDPRAATP